MKRVTDKRCVVKGNSRNISAKPNPCFIDRLLSGYSVHPRHVNRLQHKSAATAEVTRRHRWSSCFAVADPSSSTVAAEAAATTDSFTCHAAIPTDGAADGISIAAATAVFAVAVAAKCCYRCCQI